VHGGIPVLTKLTDSFKMAQDMALFIHVNKILLQRRVNNVIWVSATDRYAFRVSSSKNSFIINNNFGPSIFRQYC